MDINPSSRDTNIAEVYVEFKVSLDKIYRNEVIEFLEKLQQDSGASSNDYVWRIKYSMSFGAGEFMDNTVYLKDVGINLYNYGKK